MTCGSLGSTPAVRPWTTMASVDIGPPSLWSRHAVSRDPEPIHTACLQSYRVAWRPASRFRGHRGIAACGTARTSNPGTAHHRARDRPTTRSRVRTQLPAAGWPDWTKWSQRREDRPVVVAEEHIRALELSPVATP